MIAVFSARPVQDRRFGYICPVGFLHDDGVP